jgi:diguanylate cyclase (GGDEF)-like protein
MSTKSDGITEQDRLSCPLFPESIAICCLTQQRPAEGARTQVTSADVLPVGLRPDLALAGPGIGFFTLDLSTNLIHANQGYLELLGYQSDGLILRLDDMLSVMDEVGRVGYRAALDEIRAGQNAGFEVCVSISDHRGTGQTLSVLDRGRLFIDRGRQILAGMRVDVTGVVSPVRQLEYLVDHDDLTGLLNRRGIWRQTEQAFHLAQRESLSFCLGLLDVDHFKDVNDTHGHSVGDEVLKFLARQLQTAFNAPEFHIGRWGGEEFLVLAVGVEESALVDCVNALRHHIENTPAQASSGSIPLTLSAGIAAARRGIDSVDQVLTRADVALYRAKQDGRNRVYGSGINPDCQNMSLAILVQDAVRMARVVPVFQPLVDLQRRLPMAEEAFARILESHERVLSASAFIEVALQLQLLHRIDQMLFDAARARIEFPPMSGHTQARRAPLPIFVHISADLLRHPATLNDMARALEKHPLPAESAMILVLNEADLADRWTHVANLLDALLQRGCQLSITGYGGRDSSLEFLDHLPVGFLAFDAHLIEHALESQRARSLISSVQRRAQAAGMITIAKQIQNPQVLQLVTDLGLDWGQGYLLGVPSDPAWPASAQD